MLGLNLFDAQLIYFLLTTKINALINRGALKKTDRYFFSVMSFKIFVPAIFSLPG